MDKSRKITSYLGRGVLLCLVGQITACLGSIPLFIYHIKADYFDYFQVLFVSDLIIGAVFGLAGGLIAKNKRFIGAVVGGAVTLLPETCLLIGIGLSAW